MKDKPIYAVLRHKVFKEKQSRWEKLVDVTSLDKASKGQAKMTMIFDNAQHEKLLNDFYVRELISYQILAPDGNKLEWEGFISELPITSDTEVISIGEISFEVDGPFKMDTLFKMPVFPARIRLWKRWWLRVIRFLKECKKLGGEI